VAVTKYSSNGLYCHDDLNTFSFQLILDTQVTSQYSTNTKKPSYFGIETPNNLKPSQWLPSRICRNMVYELALVSDEEISFGNVSGLLCPPKISTAFTNHLAAYLPLTQVSKQIRDETTPMLFARNTFNVVLTTHVHEGPLTQLKRQRSSVETKALLDEASASADSGHLTYGDRHAAAWIKNARPEALKHIQRLTIEVVKADLIARWQRLQHLYKIPDSSQDSLGDFSPSQWYFHAIELKCPGLDTNIWSVDCKEKRVECKEVVPIERPGLGSQPPAKPCVKCCMMLSGWCVDSAFDGGVSREHFLNLVWSHGQ
jgi:hypothetical protein